MMSAVMGYIGSSTNRYVIIKIIDNICKPSLGIKTAKDFTSIMFSQYRPTWLLYYIDFIGE